MSDAASNLFRAKVAGFGHDPPEKAAILMEGASHEAGTVAALERKLFGEEGIPAELRRIIKRADHFAAAADRPDRPRPTGRSFWDSVRFQKRPVLIHPLSGESYDLLRLNLAPADVERFSTDHLDHLIVRDEKGAVDWRRTFLSFWRLAPDARNAAHFGALWSLWPADTRVPDHCIWDHLRLTSAFAGIFARGGSPALLMMSLGPVQKFIESARSTSDLWAGSHLLSRMAWEAMRVIASVEGPDAVVFPNLCGVPQVDLWLEEQGIELGDQDWKHSRSDANPLFAPVLPNRFLAIVPEESAAALAKQAGDAAVTFARESAQAAWDSLREKAGFELGEDDGVRQIAEQCAGFPEVHWSSAAFSLGLSGDEGIDVDRLRRALGQFYAESEGGPGFLGTPCFQLLTKSIEAEEASFYRPNAGILYPALYDLADRGLAAAKTARPFAPLRQLGYRCSLCGEREWLASDRTIVRFARGSDQRGDPFAKLAKAGSTLIKGNEHLCAICNLKRFWPSLYADEVADVVHQGDSVRRYVVSTHTMALVPVVERLAREPELAHRLGEELNDEAVPGGSPALPRRIALQLERMEKEGNGAAARAIRRLPLHLEKEENEGDPERIARRVRRLLGVRLETYYALLLMDGDRMGAWVSSLLDGERSEKRPGRPSYGRLWHPDVRTQVVDRFSGSEAVMGYMQAAAPPSPSYHASLSRALNDLSLRVIPEVVEGVFDGKILYAGGDDLMAMLPVSQLLPAILALRCAFSGVVPGRDPESIWELLKVTTRGNRIGGGHVLLCDKQLCRVMGGSATASFGAVIAHHMTPLQRVLGALREAERTAKSGGRDAFCIKLAKRSGGTSTFTSRFRFDTVEIGPDRASTGILLRTTALLKRLSRRAAYSIMAWLGNMPEAPSGDEEAYRSMLATAIAYQLLQHRGPVSLAAEEARSVATDLVELAILESSPDPARTRIERVGIHEAPGTTGFIIRALQLCEFLARSEREARGAK